jgi:hypothetical protein
MTVDDRFPLAFDRRFAPVLAAVGVVPRTAWLSVGPHQLAARFGPWRFSTAMSNVREVCVTRQYRWYTAIGPRMSFKDRGLSFGTNLNAGVCVLLYEPVAGLVPFGLVKHPGFTATVADVERCADAIRSAASLP